MQERSRESNDSRQPRTSRLRLGFLFGIIVAALGGIGFWSYLAYQHDRSNGFLLARQEEHAARLRVLAAASRRSADLRSQWEVWVAAHRPDVKAMLNGDERAYRRVWDSLPSNLANPRETGISFADLSEHEPAFTWQPITKGHVRLTGNAMEAAELDRERRYIQARNDETFKRMHDIEVARSLTTGRKWITLWASGRVTETTMLEQHVPGKPIFVEGPPREIHPPL